MTGTLVLCWVRQQRRVAGGRLPLVGHRSRRVKNPADFGSRSNGDRNPVFSGGFRNNQPGEGNDMPAEIDFSKGVRCRHSIPSEAKVLMPASIEKSVWTYFSGKAEERGIQLSDLLTEVLRRDIEINEALKKRGYQPSSSILSQPNPYQRWSFSVR
jgi:hypothetical protein